MKLLRFVLLTYALAIPAMCMAAEEINVYTAAMQSTYKIQGVGSTGTCFILGKKVSENPDSYYYVLVTAGHVLEKTQGDKATLFLRKKKGDAFEKYPFQIQIRNGDKPLWTKHTTADIAVMYVPLPKDYDGIYLDENLLATDDNLRRIEIHPGDELLCLGYPLGVESNEAGFPVLRSGKIASYPILPTKLTKTFLFDFKVFEGNSGGPVLYAYPTRVAYNEILQREYRGIIGLVIEKQYIEEKTDCAPEFGHFMLG